MSKIAVNNVSKIFESKESTFKSIDSISFKVNEGEFLCILGPSGCGKSTILRLIAGLDKTSSGQILMDNEVIIGPDCKCGMVFQEYSLFPWRSVIENVAFPLEMKGVAEEERYEIAEDYLQIVGLQNFRDSMPHELSGGMKRRLGIAQALINEPKIIIVDEPTTGLDPEERIRFRNLLSTISTQDVIIILSTHIVGDISSSCTDMALLNQGGLAFTGSPDGLVARAEGKVWLIQATEAEYLEINEKYPVISNVPNSEGWEIQVVADSINGYNGQNIAPNLEHAYVYFMESNLNQWTAI